MKHYLPVNFFFGLGSGLRLTSSLTGSGCGLVDVGGAICVVGAVFGGCTLETAYMYIHINQRETCEHKWDVNLEDG